MSDTTEVLRDQRVRAYLAELHREVAAIDPAAADGIVAEIADHVRDAAAEPGFDLDTVLSDLGDPALIAAAVEPARVDVRRSASFVDSDAGVIVALLLLTLGTYTVQALAWVVAMLLLWTSRRWTSTDKIVGTVVWPVVLVIAVPMSAALSIRGVFLLIAAIVPIPVAIWLLIRSYRGPRPALESPAAVEPVADSAVGRAGGRAWLDRWPAGTAVVLGPVLILLALTLFAITGSPRAAITGGTGALAVLGGLVVVLWRSRGWTRGDEVRGTTTLVLFALSLVVAPLAAPPPSSVVTCPGPACEPAPGVEPQPLTLLLQLAVPLMLLHAAHLAIRFRSAGSTEPLRVIRLTASGVVGLVMLGGVSFACFVAARFGVPMLLAVALPAMIVWVVGVVLLWRVEGWTAIDRVVGTFVVPALVTWPLYAPLAMSAPALGASPSSLGVPSVAIGVFVACELLVAVWLLIRFEPAHRD